MAKTTSARRRGVALLAVIVVAVIGLAVGVAPSMTARTTPAPPTSGQSVAGSSGAAAAVQSCTLFASLVSDLQAGKVTPSELAPRATAIDEQAGAAAVSDRAGFAKLANDARAFDAAIAGNASTTGTAAQALATDCQGVLGVTSASG